MAVFLVLAAASVIGLAVIAAKYALICPRFHRILI
jgi:hypothetical protein